jgi:hypothetical protein
MNPTSYFNRYIGEVLSQGIKWYDENIYYRKAQNGNRHVTPPGSGHKNKPTPEGSHVSSIYYRKA